MFKDFLKNYVYPISTIVGGVIGVGFLSLPYITLRAGMWVMLAYFIILTALVLFIHLIFGKVCLKTPDFKRWPGFIGYYFGAPAEKIMMVLMVLGTYGILLVYLIIAGQFLATTFGGNQLLWVLCYWAIASLFIFLGAKAISKFDFLAIVLLIVVLLFIFLKGLPYINIENLLAKSSQFKITDFFLPYGAILFSLWGAGFIPEAEEMIGDGKKSFKKIIIISTLIPAAIYAIFIFLVLSITGSQTTESALVGIKNMLGGGVISFVLLLGVATTFIAFIAEGLLLKRIFVYDAKIKPVSAFLLVCSVPLILFLMGINSFIPLISFIGGVLLGIEGILILLMYKKIGGKNIIVYPLSLIFILGIVYEIFYSFK